MPGQRAEAKRLLKKKQSGLWWLGTWILVFETFHVSWLEQQQDNCHSLMVPWCQRAREALQALQEHHPAFCPDWTEEDWKEHVKDARSDIPGHCRFCGLSLKGTVENLLNKRQPPGSAIPGFQHDCFMLCKAEQDALEILSKTSHNLIRVLFNRTEDSTIAVTLFGTAELLSAKQRNAVAITRCQTCGFRTQTQVRHLKAGHSPACWCVGEGSWREQNGFIRARRMIRSKLGLWRPAFDLVWWSANDVNFDSKVPLRCSRCSRLHSTTLRNIVGGSSTKNCMVCEPSEALLRRRRTRKMGALLDKSKHVSDTGNDIEM
jgi:transcription elongation factor Elf1